MLHRREMENAPYTSHMLMTSADATYDVNQAAMGETFDVRPFTPLRKVNQLPSETYELTPHGSDKVITL